MDMQRRFTDAQEQQIAAQYLAGATGYELAASWGSNQTTVRHALLRQGASRPRSHRGEGNPRWRGGRRRMAHGYMIVWLADDDPMVSMRAANGYVLEHRLVVARHLGRPLLPTETVHHINGDRVDNRYENLQLRSGQHGQGQVRKCADCGSHNIVSVAL
jgi:hypothetical protein